MKKKLYFLITLFVFMFAMGSVEARFVVEAKTIVVKNDKASTVKKVDKELKKGKKCILKVYGNSKNSKKKVESIRKKIKKVNRMGVTFQYSGRKKGKGYYNYIISTDDAKLYKYSVQFIDKLVTYTKKKIEPQVLNVLTDEKTYPDRDERYYRIIYDNLVERLGNGMVYVDGKGIYPILSGNDEKTTFSRMGYIDKKMTFWDYMEYIVVDGKYIDGTLYYEIKPFEIFKKDYDLKMLLEKVKIETASEQNLLMYNNEFCDLSDAMKIYFINESSYFDCRVYSETEPDEYARDFFGMIYTYKSFTYRGGSYGMKTLLDNKAHGVCEDYALYEMLVFDQLGISCWHNSSGKLNHAWSVVKVKNSKGKTLWIPFDYGINFPLSCGKKRFEIYLKGIPGAPEMRNWSEEDFN